MGGLSSDVKELSEKLERLLKQMPRDQAPITARSLFKSLVFGFFEEYAQWKYEHPVLSRLITLLRFFLYFALLVGLLWWVAGTAAGRLTGLEGVKNRVVYAYYSAMWASKGVPSVDSLPQPPKRFSGTIEKVVGDVLVISYYDNGKSVRRLARPANVIITDKKGFQGWAEQYLLKGVTVDFYIPIDKTSNYDVWGVVFWSNRVPINVELVEQGFGTPERNPETVIVNRIYSQYYLQRARSG